MLFLWLDIDFRTIKRKPHLYKTVRLLLYSVSAPATDSAAQALDYKYNYKYSLLLYKTKRTQKFTSVVVVLLVVGLSTKSNNNNKT